MSNCVGRTRIVTVGNQPSDAAGTSFDNAGLAAPLDTTTNVQDAIVALAGVNPLAGLSFVGVDNEVFTFNPATGVVTLDAPDNTKCYVYDAATGDLIENDRDEDGTLTPTGNVVDTGTQFGPSVTVDPDDNTTFPVAPVAPFEKQCLVDAAGNMVGFVDSTGSHIIQDTTELFQDGATEAVPVALNCVQPTLRNSCDDADLPKGARVLVAGDTDPVFGSVLIGPTVPVLGAALPDAPNAGFTELARENGVLVINNPYTCATLDVMITFDGLFYADFGDVDQTENWNGPITGNIRIYGNGGFLGQKDVISLGANNSHYFGADSGRALFASVAPGGSLSLDRQVRYFNSNIDPTFEPDSVVYRLPGISFYGVPRYT